MADCCLDCHFAYEEQHVLPLLPRSARVAIRREHDVLRRTGYPPAAVLRHAEAEMKIFRQHGVPKPILAKLQAEHDRIAANLRPRFS